MIGTLMLPPRARATGVIVPILLLLAALPLAGRSLVRELALSHLQKEMALFDSGQISADRMQRDVDLAVRCGDSCPAGMLLAAASAEASIAAGDPRSPSGRLALAGAGGIVPRLLSLRPDWGPALTAAAAIGSIRDGPTALSTIETFRRSYVAAPYLREQAPWRLRFAATAAWPQLDEPTRAAVLEEARWYASLGWQDQDTVVNALGDTPAGARFAIMRILAEPPPDASAR